MHNTNKQIAEFMEYYFTLRGGPQYAVLIKGMWGSGKSWFVNSVVTGLKPSGVKSLYVSLYGITTTKDIEEEFFRQLHPVLGSKGVALGAKIIKGFIRGTLKIDLDGDGKEDGAAQVGIPDLNMPDYLRNTQGLVLIFDDVERCSMPIADLLGYINYYVEHDGYRVVLIANEDEIIAQADEEDISRAYVRVKEKLIGKTFEIVPELSDALDHFVRELPQEVGSVVAKNRQIVEDIYKASKYKNLRHLRQALMDFSRLYFVLAEEAKIYNGLLQELLVTFLIFTIEIRSGRMNAKDIAEMNTASIILEKMTESNNGKSLYKGLSEKYKYFNFNPIDPFLPGELWSSIFSTGLLDKEKINAAILQTSYFPTSQPDWLRLWHGISLLDAEFEGLLSKVEQDFLNEKIGNPGVVLHIVGMLMNYSKMGVYGKTILEVLQLAEEVVMRLLSAGLLETLDGRNRLFFDTGWGGYGFAGNELPEFLQFKRFLLEKLDEAAKARLPGQAKRALENMVRDPKSFVKSILHTFEGAGEFSRSPIFMHVEAKDFLCQLLAVSPDDRRLIISALKERYEDVSIQVSLMDELPWLKCLVVEVEKEQAARSGKISGINMAYFSKVLCESIERLMSKTSAIN